MVFCPSSDKKSDAELECEFAAGQIRHVPENEKWKDRNRTSKNINSFNELHHETHRLGFQVCSLRVRPKGNYG